MKKHIVKALKWALSKFEDKAPKIEAWPFPVPAAKKPALKKLLHVNLLQRNQLLRKLSNG